MYKKVLAITLVLFVFLTGCSQTTKKQTTSTASATSADPFGKYSDTVTLNVCTAVSSTDKLPTGDTPESNQYTRYVKDKLNVDIKTLWSAASGTAATQKLNLAIASNNLPDAFIVNISQLNTLVASGQIEDLTNVYKNYVSDPIKKMSDTSKGAGVAACTFKGKIMAMPAIAAPIDQYNITWVRKDWLEKLNLTAPKTMDDLKKIAKAFIEKDPDGNSKADTIGIAGPSNGGALYSTFMSSSMGECALDTVFLCNRSYPGYWIKGTDGKATYGSIQPETKTALQELATMYKDGILDKQVGIRKSSSETLTSGKCGIFFGPWWEGYSVVYNTMVNDPKANWQAYCLLDSKGVYNYHTSSPASSFMVVRKGYAHPEAAIKIVNLMNRDEGTFDLTKGSTGYIPLRLASSAYDGAKVTIQAMKDVLNNKKQVSDYQTDQFSCYKLLVSDVTAIKSVKTEPYDKYDSQYWNVSANKSAFQRAYSLLVGGGAVYDSSLKSNGVSSLTYGQTDSMTAKWENLKKLEDQTFLKIVMGDQPISTFDQFVKDWKAQGGDTIIAEVQKTVSDKG